jgi:hypothetical protein
MFFDKTILVNTSDAIMALGEPELIWGEILHYFGMWLLMSTISRYSRDNF